MDSNCFWGGITGWWFPLEKHKMTNLIYPRLHLRWCPRSRRHLSGKSSLYAETLTLYTLLIMTSTCRACEALPFKHRGEKNSTLWKWAALPRALQQRDRKVRAFHTPDKVLRVASGRAKVRRFCEIRFRQDTIRVNHCRRKCLKSREWKGVQCKPTLLPPVTNCLWLDLVNWGCSATTCNGRARRGVSLRWRFQLTCFRLAQSEKRLARGKLSG